MAAKFIGAHIPAGGKGLAAAIRRGKELGCTAAQVFTTSPRNWKTIPPTIEKIAEFKTAVAETGIDHVASHDTYLVNLCAGPDVAAKSHETLRDELLRSSLYGIPLVVSHIGSVRDEDSRVAYEKSAAAILEILAETPDDVTLCMETTAGQGSALNSRFEEIALLLELCKAPSRLAVCLDSCHVFVAGYDIRSPETFDLVLTGFDCLIGLERLKLIHLNDSKKGLGSHVDRHENIGEGCLGLETFRHFVNDPRLERIPMVIETPVENEGHERDMANLLALRS